MTSRTNLFYLTWGESPGNKENSCEIHATGFEAAFLCAKKNNAIPTPIERNGIRMVNLGNDGRWYNENGASIRRWE